MKNKIRLPWAAMGAALLCAAALSGGDLMPLQDGNTWVYRESNTGSEFTIRAGTPVVTNGLVYHTLTGYTPERLLVRMNEQNQLVYFDQEREKEMLLTSFEPFEGGWWNAPFRICDQLAQTLEKRGTFDGAAGPFHGVVEIRYRTFSCGDAGTESEQYAENIGMVRRVTSSIAGPRTYDLVHARVGAAIIEALPHGRFTVTAAAKPDFESLTATLRLQHNSSVEMKLPFPTAQEYEVQLLDSEGKVLWKWSDGLYFDQAAHERGVAGGWTVQVEIPRPLRINTGPSAEIYIVQAWITNSDVPRYAASVPVIISSNGN